MQEYVQKSIRTTLPRRESRLNGAELSHPTAPVKSGIGPSSPRWGPDSAALTGRIAGFSGPNALIKCASALVVFTKENLVSRFVSHPSAMATTPMITATPKARRIQASNDKERFMAENALLPAKSAMPRELAAPSAKDSNNKDERAPGPWIAAPVKIRPRIGPAQGAQSNPVEIP